MKNRTVGFDSPVNIYEIHAGSWRKKGEGQTDWYTYIELAKDVYKRQCIPRLNRLLCLNMMMQLHLLELRIRGVM